MVQIWSLAAVAAAILPGVVTGVPSYGTCSTKDACLKAVKAKSCAFDDCKAALQKTVTAKACTKTITRTKRTTITSTRSAAGSTITSTIIVSTTNTILTTENFTTSISQTSTFVPIVTTTVTSTASPNMRARDIAELEARNDGRLPPAYAAKSCNTSQYKSACSCIGVRPSTKTISSPESTITVTTTSTLYATKDSQQSTSTVLVTKISSINESKTISSTSTITDSTTVTAPPSTTTVTVTTTANPDDAVPTFRGCPEDDNAYKLDQVMTAPGNRRLVLVDENGAVTLTRSFGEAKNWYQTQSGLLREAFAPNRALQAVDGPGFSFLSVSDNLGSGVLRCSRQSSRLGGPEVICSSGDKNVFYECPAQADGTTLAIGNPDFVATSPRAAGCTAIRFLATSGCQA